MLSAYELQRQQNIDRNNAQLEALGLHTGASTLLGKTTAPPKERKQKTSDQPPHEPSRKQPKRDSGSPASYGDMLSLDDLDEMDRYLQRKKKNPALKLPKQRKLKLPRAKEPTSMSNLVPRRQTAYSTSAPMPPMTMNRTQRLFRLNVVPDQLQAANYPQKDVDAFKQFCVQHADQRVPTMAKKRKKEDIVAIADAVVSGKDLSSLDQSLLTEFQQEMSLFRPISYQLAQHDCKNNGYNPAVVCQSCGGTFALTNSGAMRKHDCV